MRVCEVCVECEGVWSVCGGVGCVECVWGCVECEGYQLYDRFSSKIHGPVKIKIKREVLDGIAGYFRGTKFSRFSRIDPETGRLVKKFN